MTCRANADSQDQEKEVGRDRRFKPKIGNTDKRRTLKPARANTGSDTAEGPPIGSDPMDCSGRSLGLVS
jgi:hypothetical protein